MSLRFDCIREAEFETPIFGEEKSQARTGVITIREESDGKDLSDSRQRKIEIPTPLFMPVGTAGTVKSMTPDDLEAIGAHIVLGNTYHLYLRPGHERVERLGGLHEFMQWKGPILTDSGGFQVFSLAGINQIDDEGVTFQSHIDGSYHRFTPELSMAIQKSLGSDFVMAFDQCPPFPATEEEVRRAMDRTLAWAKRGLEFALQPHQLRFGIFQGGLYEKLRVESLQQISELPFDAFAIGGLSIGEKMDQMQSMCRFIAPKMPKDRPRYLMGVGRPEDLVEGVNAGIDLFDCVMPTRNARNGQLFTHFGKINIKNACFAEDRAPVDPDCGCYVCRKFTRAYLRHLYVSQEHLSARLNTYHNLYYYLDLMAQMRKAIAAGEFQTWRKTFYRKRQEVVR